MKKAILVVSFGTSFDETREKTIGAIEKEIAKEFPDYIVKRAFTSGVIMNNLAKRGIIIPNVVTALEELSAQGVTDVFVQPTHIIPGEEYDKLVSMAEGCKDKFGSFKIGKPLMWNENDYKNVSDFLIKEYGDTEKAVILMGHGTEHRANDVYLKLSDILESHNIFVGTVENKPDIYDVLNTGYTNSATIEAIPNNGIIKGAGEIQGLKDQWHYDGDLFTLGQNTIYDCVITDIKYNEDNTATLTARDY